MTEIKGGDLFADLPTALPEELVTVLAENQHVRIERIVSTAHASPNNFWYDQSEHEWVVVLKGSTKENAMAHHNQFIIRNDLSDSLILNIEPEGAFFPLEKGEEVFVFDEFTTAPVTVKLTNSDKGDPILSIWPGDGDVRVEKNGVNVLDLIQRRIGI